MEERIGGRLEEQCREAIMRYITEGKVLMTTKAEALKKMLSDLKEAQANYLFQDLRMKTVKREYDMELAVTRHFVEVKGGSKDDERHVTREIEALGRKLAAERESGHAWVMLDEHRQAVKAMKDALVQLEKHVNFWHRNMDKHVDALIRANRGEEGSTRAAVTVETLECDCGNTNCDYPLLVGFKRTSTA